MKILHVFDVAIEHAEQILALIRHFGVYVENSQKIKNRSYFILKKRNNCLFLENIKKS